MVVFPYWAVCIEVSTDDARICAGVTEDAVNVLLGAGVSVWAVDLNKVN